MDPIENLAFADHRDEAAETAAYEAFRDESVDEQFTLRAAVIVNGRTAVMEKRKALIAEVSKLAPPYHREGQQRIAEFDRQAAAAVDAAVQELLERAAKTADRHIITQPPSYAPKDATHAAEVNGIAADAVNYHPIVFARVAREARARGDMALMKRLFDIGQSLAGYRAPFQKSSEITTVLQELAGALDTPQQKRSRAAATWKRETVTQLQILRAQVLDPRGDVWLYAQTGALSHLFPNRTIQK